MQEAYRILKPEGRLVICDGYKKRSGNKEEKQIIDDFIYGFGLKEMITAEEMAREMFKAGFINLKVVSKRKEVEKPVKYFSVIGRILMLAASPIKNLHPIFLAMFRNGLADVSADKAIKKGLADYCLHLAVKPRA